MQWPADKVNGFAVFSDCDVCGHCTTAVSAGIVWWWRHYDGQIQSGAMCQGGEVRYPSQAGGGEGQAIGVLLVFRSTTPRP